MFNFLPLINNSDTIGLNYFLLSISAIISLKTINYLHFLFELYSSISFEYSIKTLESFKVLSLYFLVYQLKIEILLRMDFKHINKFY